MVYTTFGDDMKALAHFKTITKHKIIVGRLCFRVGLYKQGLCHDLSKYSWCEFSTGAHYYQGTYSPNAAERREKGYSLAWLHHKGRNKHHWEFWVDFTREGMKPARMPYRYVTEMFCDRVAASMVYKGTDYDDAYPLYYYKQGAHAYCMDPMTRALLVYQLTYLKEHGMKKTLAMIKKKKDYTDYDLDK